VKGHIMAKQTINLGSSANDGTGDPLRTAFDKVNDNFGELYTATGAGSGQNISISGQKIVSDNSNGNIELDPAGTGEVVFLAHSSMGDSFKHQMGDSDDFQIYHDGNHSYITDAGTGNLKIAGTQVDILGGADGAETMATFVDNGAVSLYYDNAVKIATVTAGIAVTGDVATSTINTGAAALTIGGQATVSGALIVTGATTLNNNVVIAAGSSLNATSIIVDSNISLDGNRVFTRLSNSDIDLDPAGTGTVNLRVPVQTTVGSAGGASAVPATPTTYLKIKVNGVSYVVPAFAVS
jgi:hypothetical protein